MKMKTVGFSVKLCQYLRQMKGGRIITVKPLFIVFVGGLEKKRWIRENNRCGSLCKIGFAQGPQKLNDGSGKRVIRER
jgi:hypothetical protein